MYEATVVVTVVLMLVSAVDYVRRAWIKETTPVLATWILMTTMITLSFSMYMVSDRKSWTGNIAVVAALLNGWMILIGLVVVNARNGTLSVVFEPVQRASLAFGVAVVGLWCVTAAPLLAYTLVQVIALIGYAVTVKKLWTLTRSTEPLSFWVISFIACCSALYPAWVRMDPFSWIYLARAVPSTLFLSFLIARIKWRMLLRSIPAMSEPP